MRLASIERARCCESFKVLAQPLVDILKRGGASFTEVELAAQLLVRGAEVGEQRLQRGVVEFFLLQRAQRLGDRLGNLVEGILERVELANAPSGVAEQAAQRLVLFSKSGAGLDKTVLVDRFVDRFSRLLARDTGLLSDPEARLATQER